MKSSKNFKLIGSLSLACAIVAALTVILAPPFVRLLRMAAGPILFWAIQILIVGIFMVLGMGSMALTYGGISILIGIFFELEKRGMSIVSSGLISATVALGVSFGAAKVVVEKSGLSLMDSLHEQIKAFVDQYSKVNGALKLDVDTLVNQMPSAVFCFFLILLFISIALESKVSKLFKVEIIRGFTKPELLMFKLPDFYIWIALSSFLFSFVDMGNKPVMVIAANIVNIFAVVYFFQGIAIIESFFVVMKFGTLIRVLSYFVLMFQLFLLVTSIGFIDYWAEFRTKFIIKKKTINT